MASRVDLDFSTLIDEVKKMEKKGEICVINPTWVEPINFSIDFSPEEYDEWQFIDILHFYRAISRIQRLKVMKFGAKREVQIPRTMEIEKIQAQPSINHKHPYDNMDVKKENRTSAVSYSNEKLKEREETQQAIGMDRTEKVLKELSPKIVPAQEKQEKTQNNIEIDEKKTEEFIHQSPIISIPEFLKEDPLKKAEEELEKQLNAGRVVKVNPKEIREKMIELTKMLFKEQDAVKRKKIKEELSMLRVMLKKKNESDNKNLLFKSLEKSQREELLNAKDTILRTWRRAISSVIHSYLSVLTSSMSNEVRKKAKELFLDDIDSVKDQSINLINTYYIFLSKKHGEEWEILKKKLLNSPSMSSIDIDEMKRSADKKIKDTLEKLKFILSKRGDEIKALSEEQLKAFIQVIDKDFDEIMNRAKNVRETNEFIKGFEKGALSKEELLFQLRWILKDAGDGKNNNEVEIQYENKEGLDVGQNS